MFQHHPLRTVLSGLSLIVLLVLAACNTAPFSPTLPADTPTAVAGAPTAAPPTPPPASAHVEVLRLSGGGYWGHPSPFGFNRGPGYTRASLLFFCHPYVNRKLVA